MNTLAEVLNKKVRMYLSVHTPHGTGVCVVPEFKREEYKGLRSGIGRGRRSSKHFNCFNPPLKPCANCLIEAIRVKAKK